MSRCFLISTLLLILVAASSFGASPTVMNYQGRLTDNLGDPVADGNFTVTFTIYDAAFAGNSKWQEARLVTTTDGFFSIVIGSLAPIEDTVFNGTVRWLGIQVDLDPELSPRTKFTTMAYSHRVSTIDGTSGGSVSGDVDITTSSSGNALSVTQSGSGLAAEFDGAVNSFGDHVLMDGADTAFHLDISQSQLSTFGSDGLEQIRLWGKSYGEIQLHDNTDNDITAVLSASSNTGGKLDLMDGNGNTWIELDAGNATDASVMIPQGAINAIETGEEAGVANRIDNSVTFLTGGSDTILVRTITVPASGHVLVIASLNMKFIHNSNTQSVGRMRVGFAGGSHMIQDVRVGTWSASANWEIPTTVQGLFDVSAGANQFALVVGQVFGSISVENAQLTLVYFPTNYGLVTSNTAITPDNGPTTSAEELAEAKAFNAQRLDDELSTLRQKMNSLQVQLDAQKQ